MRREIPNAREVSLLAELWQELADAPAAQAGDALRHCMDRLCVQLGARNALWVAAVRQETANASTDPYLGWRVRGLEYLHDGQRLMKSGREIVSRMEEGAIDQSAIGTAARAGSTRALLRNELLDEEAQRNDWVLHEVLADERIGDRLEGAHAVSTACESHIILERGIGERPFTPLERNLLHLFLLGSRTFQRELMLSRGVMETSAPLSLREQDVVKLLLTDASEKEIAQRLGIGYRTVHQHAQSIYAKFGVRGRQGLMAKWLRAK